MIWYVGFSKAKSQPAKLNPIPYGGEIQKLSLKSFHADHLKDIDLV